MNKKVDISIFKNNTPVAAIGVKFIMSNYLQNSNNYFENMEKQQTLEAMELHISKFLYFQILCHILMKKHKELVK